MKTSSLYPPATTVNCKTNSPSVPTYLNVPLSVLKYMLKSSVEGSHSIEHMLNTNERLEFIHELAISINDYCFLNRKHEFWQFYYQTVNSHCLWDLNSGKIDNSIHRKYLIEFKDRIQVERLLQELDNHIKQKEKSMQALEKQALEEFLTTDRLFAAILAMVRKGQHRLSMEYERRKTLLNIKVQHQQLIRSFTGFESLDSKQVDIVESNLFSVMNRV